MGAAQQNTASPEPGEGCTPNVFGGMVTRTVGPRPWGQMERREGSEYEGG